MSVGEETFELLIRSIPKGRVLLPGSDEYEKSLMRWSATCVKRAAVVVKPTDAQETSAAVRFATAAKMPLAVRCGGHSTRGASSSNGMVIDLSLMRSVNVDPISQTAEIGGGSLNKHVDAATWEYGLVTLTGAEPNVGYGGFVLGGGYSFLTGQYGMACDNLVELEVVLADGRIVHASEHDGDFRDLFWALRGAGANFGVCTKFTARVYPQGPAWAGLLLFGLELLPDIVAFANRMHEHHDGREYFNFAFTSAPPPIDEPVIACLVFYNGDRKQGEAYFGLLFELRPLLNTTKMGSWPEINCCMTGKFGPSRKLQGSANFVMPLDLNHVGRACDDFFAFIQDRDSLKSSLMAWEVIPYDNIRKLSNTDTAFGARNEMYQITAIFEWDDWTLDEEVRAYNENFSRTMKKKGVGKGVQQYNNYDGQYFIETRNREFDRANDKQAVYLTPEDAYGENLERLRELKRKYDPTNVFSNWHSIW